MNNRVLYHASTVVVNSPLVHVGRSDLDFGPGFYMTHDKEQAVSWALTLASRKKQATPVVNIYEFDEDIFESDGFSRLVFEDYSLEWLDFVAASRKGKNPWKFYDWIEGGIANDSVISTVDAYVDGFITAEQAIGKLVREELRHQVCISNQMIIDKFLHFVRSENIS